MKIIILIENLLDLVNLLQTPSLVFLTCYFVLSKSWDFYQEVLCLISLRDFWFLLQVCSFGYKRRTNISESGGISFEVIFTHLWRPSTKDQTFLNIMQSVCCPAWGGSLLLFAQHIQLLHMFLFGYYSQTSLATMLILCRYVSVELAIREENL